MLHMFLAHDSPELVFFARRSGLKWPILSPSILRRRPVQESIHEVRFATGRSHMSRDQLFDIVRDGGFVDAKKAFAKTHMSWRHTALQQEYLFFLRHRTAGAPNHWQRSAST